jgi:hypothetical protein
MDWDSKGYIQWHRLICPMLYFVPLPHHYIISAHIQTDAFFILNKLYALVLETSIQRQIYFYELVEYTYIGHMISF